MLITNSLTLLNTLFEYVQFLLFNLELTIWLYLQQAVGERLKSLSNEIKLTKNFIFQRIAKIWIDFKCWTSIISFLQILKYFKSNFQFNLLLWVESDFLKQLSWHKQKAVT